MYYSEKQLAEIRERNLQATKLRVDDETTMIEKQTLEVTREQDAAYYTEKQLAETRKINPQVTKLPVGDEETMIEKQTLEVTREQDAAYYTEKQLAEIRIRSLQATKLRVGDEETKKLEVQKPLPPQLHSQKPPHETLSRIQEHSSLTSPLVTTSRSPSETVTAGPKNSSHGEFHHPFGGRCTLAHPPGESCPVNVSETLQELKITGKPRETRYQCDLCGESIEALWKYLTHKEEIHGIEMPKQSKGVATSGTEDKPNDIEEQTSENNVLKSQVAGPDHIESANTTSKKTSENQEGGDDCTEHKSEIDSGASLSVTNHSKIPVSVIELLDDDRAAPSKNVNKERPSPVRGKDEIRGPLFSATVSSITSSAAVHQSGLSSSAVNSWSHRHCPIFIHSLPHTPLINRQ